MTEETKSHGRAAHKTQPDTGNTKKIWSRDDSAHVVWIYAKEAAAINARRTKLGRDRTEFPASIAAGSGVIDAVGLSLSGGGVRSAAISLGILQALNYHNVLRNVDYLSTVSGGGYIGCSLTASMTKSGGEFVFGSVEKTAAPVPTASDVKDTEAVGHIRNYSNYLIPAGMRDVVTALAIIARGLVANIALVAPIVLMFAAITIWCKPTRNSLLETSINLHPIYDMPTSFLGVTLAMFLAGLLLFFLWAIYRSLLTWAIYFSLLKPDWLSEFRTRLPFYGAMFLVLLAITFFCELQPYALLGMFNLHHQGNDQGVTLTFMTGLLKTLAATFAPIGAVVTLFRQQLGDTLKSLTDGYKAATLRAAIKLSIWIAGLALPLCIWVAYLYLCFWGIADDMPARAASTACPPSVISATIDTGNPKQTYKGELKGDLGSCAVAGNAGASDQTFDPLQHAPRWLRAAVGMFGSASLSSGPIAPFYFWTAILLIVLAWFPLTPNANSLHRLYRDRLSKAFLFDPTKLPEKRPGADVASLDQGRDFASLDVMRLSELSDADAPYHLINATLNIQGSDYANRRGRNGDFFLFSKYGVGSLATGYAETADVEKDSSDLDLATAMAISGAAVSSNMGADTIKPLAPTLALLNIRLGYWLRNPAFLARTGLLSPDQQQAANKSWLPRHRVNLYLWSEISGRLYENSNQVYLTDGGHIENLGIYELLRRRCKFIIAVDAEADCAMHFPALITLQRYARIDLGVRINLPWEQIEDTTLAWMYPPKDQALQPKLSEGPHAAVGTIDYGGGETGYLLYLKSSLTGDENDYIRDYARRYSTFPHESTGDQFFTEEQFEAYRALGFHIADGVFSGSDNVAVGSPEAPQLEKFSSAANDAINALRLACTGSLAPDPTG